MSIDSSIAEVVEGRPGVAPLPPAQHTPSTFTLLGHWAKELAIVVGFVLIYEWLRNDMIQSAAGATAHSLSIVRIESDLGIFHEESIQSWFLHFPDVVRGFNLYYGGTHFVVPAAALLYLAIRHPARYARARNLLGVTTGVAFVIFWRFPVAPPRLLPQKYGIIDTLVTMGNSGHAEARLIDSAGDIYAAMPSLHVAWALWCLIVLYPVVRSRLVRGLLIAYPVATTLVVVATGNHFFLDAASGAALMGVTYLAVREIEALFHTRPALARVAPLEEMEPASLPSPNLAVAPAEETSAQLTPPMNAVIQRSNLQRCRARRSSAERAAVPGQSASSRTIVDATDHQPG